MRNRVVTLIVLCCMLIAVSPFIGKPIDTNLFDFIFWQLRLPRTLMALLVGSTMGLVGAVFQTLFNNKLATPGTIGTTAGAALGSLIALVCFENVHASIWGMSIVTIAAFLGAVLSTLCLALIAFRGASSSNDVLLAGIALTLAAGALSTGLQFHADMAETFRAIRWSLGDLAQVGYGGVVFVAPFVCITLVVLLLQIKAIAAMMGGEEIAFSQGVNVHSTRALCLLIGALGTGACVAWCGPIAFVGLIVPHFVRMYASGSSRILLPLSTLVGAAFLPFCDALARVILQGSELPVGVLTSALGAPLLILLIYRNRRLNA